MAILPSQLSAQAPPLMGVASCAKRPKLQYLKIYQQRRGDDDENNEVLSDAHEAIPQFGGNRSRMGRRRYAPFGLEKLGMLDGGQAFTSSDGKRLLDGTTPWRRPYIELRGTLRYVVTGAPVTQRLCTMSRRHSMKSTNQTRTGTAKYPPCVGGVTRSRAATASHTPGGDTAGLSAVPAWPRNPLPLSGRRAGSPTSPGPAGSR